ncbi:MAG: PAS domain S-box protein [bacterium]
MKGLSIRNRLALSATGLVLVVVAVVASAAYHEARQSAIAAANERLTGVARQLSDLFGASARQLRDQQGKLARDSAVLAFVQHRDEPSRLALIARLSVPTVFVAGVSGVEVWDTSGTRLLAVPDTLAPLPESDVRALATPALADSSFIGWLGGAAGHLGYSVATPIHLGSGTVGVLVTRRKAATTSGRKQLLDLIGSGAGLLIGNARGDVWTDLVDRAPAPPLHNWPVTGTVEYERPAGHAVIAALTPIAHTPWLIAVEAPRDLVLAPTIAMLRRLALFTLLLLCAAAAGAWALSGTLTRPITRLVDVAEAMKQGDYSRRVELRADEFGILGTAFNASAERVMHAHDTLEFKLGELEDAEARYRMLFESSPQPMWVYDLETLAFLAVNDAAVSRYGFTRDEFVHMTLRDIRPPEDVPVLLENIAHHELDGVGQSQVWRHRSRDGLIIDVEVSSRALQFAGRSARIVLIRDLTERRRAEEALRSSQERLDRVLSTSGAVLYELRLDSGRTVLEWMSENVTQLLGYSKDETRRPHWWSDNVHPVDRASLGAQAQPAGFRDGAYEYRFRHRDGRYRWLREEQRSVRDGAGMTVRIVGAWLDITEQRQLEIQFRQAQKMEAVGRLAGGIAHDFNNLLTIILAESQFLSASAVLSPFERAESVEQIAKAAERAALLTRQLLAFSRRQLIEAATVDLNVIVNDVDRMLRRLVGEDVDLKLGLDSAPVVTVADRGQLEQVIVNLAVNARDAMPEGGALTIGTATVMLDQAYADTHADVTPGPFAVIHVSDTGMGMSDEVKTHLFEPFFTTKEVGKGTGLGLATCYAIVRQFGGHIGVYSEVGLGTTIRVYLPASAGAPTATARGEAALEKRTELVLLVEDDAQVRRITARMLESHGHRVLQASNGELALSLLEQSAEQVALLISDVVLHGMGGREIAERVVAMSPQTRVLFVSGYSDDVILQHRLVQHEVALLHKPFTADALARKVRDVMEQAPQAG